MDIATAMQDANTIKEMLLGELERQNYLKVPALKLMQEWSIILVKRHWLGRKIAEHLGASKDETAYYYKLVKMVNIAEPEHRKSQSQLGTLTILKKGENSEP